MEYKKNEIGKIIRERRKALHLTQEALAQLAGVSFVTINQLENGKRKNPHNSSIKAIMEILEVYNESQNNL